MILLDPSASQIICNRFNKKIKNVIPIDGSLQSIQEKDTATALLKALS